MACEETYTYNLKHMDLMHSQPGGGQLLDTGKARSGPKKPAEAADDRLWQICQWETQRDVGGPVVGGCCLHRYIKTCLGAQALPGEQQVLHLAMGLVAQTPI